MKVLYAADYRKGVAYQQLLADALLPHGVEACFYSDYRRVFPLARGLREFKPDLFHLHWPEAYFPKPEGLHQWLRKMRYPLDLWLAVRKVPMVLTVHNLFPHNRSGEALVLSWMRWSCACAEEVIVHSGPAAKEVEKILHVDPARLHVIPSGDLSVALPPPVGKSEARRRLGLDPETKRCLIFGVVSPYKGILPLVEWWKRERPEAKLHIVGASSDARHGLAVRKAVAGCPDIVFQEERVSDPELALWLDAADACLFNYNRMLVPGGLQTALARGVPLLVPAHLDSIDLMEPNPLVFRFDRPDASLQPLLMEAMARGRDEATAVKWKERISWPVIAERHAGVYRKVLG